MAVEVLMPKLGLTMQEGTITAWSVESGTPVTAGTVVMTIETDKVEAEVEADADGILSHGAAVGETLECGEVVGWLLGDGEEAPAVAPTQAPAAQSSEAATVESTPPPRSAPAARGEGGRLLASPNARRLARERGIELATVTGTGPGGRITSDDLPDTALTSPAPVFGGERRFVPYVVRAMAQRLGVDLAAVSGSGPDGRVTRADVFAASGESRPRSAKVEGAAPHQPGDVISITGMRAVIAERMSSSLDEAAQLSLFLDVRMDKVVELREQLRDIGSDELGAIPGYTDFVVAAVARAVREHPLANSSVLGDELHLHTDVHVGVAVALDEGLVVPVVRHADSLPLPDLAVETSRLAEAARSKSLALAELEGSTISVTALGMFGVDGFTPIINQPNTAIVGVGRIRDETAWTDAGPTAARVLTLSLTWDHRAFDGAPAARFAGAIRDLMEQPLRLLA